MIKLNLGCGFNHQVGYINVDRTGKADQYWDLENFPWPWEDDSVDKVLLQHTLEHLGQRTETFLTIMTELYRVCCDGANILITVPHPRHDHFLWDPTHVRPITVQGLSLFSKEENLEQIKINSSSTPLALNLGVDFKITAVQRELDPVWLKKREVENLTDEQIGEAVKRYNNVVKETSIVLTVIKPDSGQDSTGQKA